MIFKASNNETSENNEIAQGNGKAITYCDHSLELVYFDVSVQFLDDVGRIQSLPHIYYNSKNTKERIRPRMIRTLHQLIVFSYIF
jgi:hypothetical protein